MKEKKVDDQTVMLMAKLLDVTTEEAKEIVELVFSRKETCKEEIVPIKEVLELFGFSYSTLKRRLDCLDISLVTLPGFRIRKGLYRKDVERIMNHNFSK